MSQLPGAFGLLDFNMLQPVLAWRAFLNLRTVYFFNFQTFFSSPGKPRIPETADNESVETGAHLYLYFDVYQQESTVAEQDYSQTRPVRQTAA
jgi:hypothetical protein